MKSIFKSSALAALFAVSLAATAQAQTLNGAFVTQQGDAVSVASVSTVTRAGYQTVLTAGTTAPVKIDDGSFILYNKMIADAWFLANFVGYGTNWVNVNDVMTTRCVASRSIVQLVNNPTPLYLSDNCYVNSQMKARSK